MIIDAAGLALRPNFVLLLTDGLPYYLQNDQEENYYQYYFRRHK